MSTYRLIYFNSRGRAESARMMFTLAGQKFEDVRYDYEGEKWKEYKPSTPFGQLPVLEFDGTTLCQGAAIDRFLAKRLGFDGENDIIFAKIDMLIGCIEDMSKPLLKWFDRENNDEEKAKIKLNYQNEHLPKQLLMMEKMVESDKFIFGNKMTLGDLSVYNALYWQRSIGIEFTLPPKLQTVYTNVETDPKIADYLSKRPVTEF